MDARARSDAGDTPLRAAEFFAGIGLVRAAIERDGWRVIFANDIEPFKRDIYAANFDAEHFLLGDVRQVRGADLPEVELVTASFPCTDLSLAGNRKGLAGEQSGLFWELARVLDEMGERRPPVVVLENVPSLATSHQGRDLAAIVERLNSLGYRCELTIIDSRAFVPQSRTRLFIIGWRSDETWSAPTGALPGFEHLVSRAPKSLQTFLTTHPKLDARLLDLAPPANDTPSLASVVERLSTTDARWWNGDRLERFLGSLSSRNAERLADRRSRSSVSWSTAYRRTRNGRAVWEIRSDNISGCLRTARGGSSRQAIVEAGQGAVRVRWMLSGEYARLQGAAGFVIPPDVSENQALFGFGDAVTVPAVEWLFRTYVTPRARALAQAAARGC